MFRWWCNNQPPWWRDERGQAEALLAAAFITLLAMFVSGYLAVETAVRHKERLTAAGVAAARAAAAEMDPDSFITGQARIDPVRARQTFDAAFPGLAGLNADWTAPAPATGSPPDASVLAGRVGVDRFEVYSAQDAGRQDCGGQPVAGPGVCVRLSAPARVMLPGGVPYDFTIATVARAAAPSFGAGGWQYQ